MPFEPSLPQCPAQNEVPELVQWSSAEGGARERGRERKSGKAIHSRGGKQLIKVGGRAQWVVGGRAPRNMRIWGLGRQWGEGEEGEAGAGRGRRHPPAVPSEPGQDVEASPRPGPGEVDAQGQR